MTDPLLITADRLRLVLLRHVAPRVADEVVAELGETGDDTEPEPDVEAVIQAADRDYRRRGGE